MVVETGLMATGNITLLLHGGEQAAIRLESGILVQAHTSPKKTSPKESTSSEKKT